MQGQHQQRADHREDHVGERLHEHMQAPVLGAGHQLVARQCRAMQEEDQCHAHAGDHAQVQRALAGADFRGGQGDGDGGQHDEDKAVDQVIKFLELGKKARHDCAWLGFCLVLDASRV
ncbi:hypothetical protein D9M68_855000 [compost metagenome]